MKHTIDIPTLAGRIDEIGLDPRPFAQVLMASFGQSAVEELGRHLGLPFHYCPACESQEPTVGSECLCCGSAVRKTMTVGDLAARLVQFNPACLVRVYIDGEHLAISSASQVDGEVVIDVTYQG